MANKTEATLTLKVKDLATKKLDGFRSSLNKIKGRITFAIGAIVALGAAMGGLALKASELEEVEKSFQALAASQGESADQMLDKMRELSVGTITDLELMKKANNALLLGLPVERFGDMLTIARSASKATGQSMEFMLNSIVTGLGRGSKLMLDNLGILVNTEKAQTDYARSIKKSANELTELDKKHAFLNAALKTGTDNVEKAGGSTISLRDQWAQLKTSIINMSLELGKKFIPVMSAAIGIINKSFTAITKLGDVAETTWNFLAKAAAPFGGLLLLTEQTIDQNEELKKLNKTLGEQIKKKTELKTANDNVKSSNEGMTAGMDIAKQNSMALVAAQEIEIQKTREKIAAINELVAADKAATAASVAELQKKKDAIAAAAEIKAESDAIAIELEQVRKEQAIENEQIFRDAMMDLTLQAENARLDAILQSNVSHDVKVDALNKKRELKEKTILQAKKNRETAFAKFQKFMQGEQVKGAQAFFSSIQGLAESKNSFLAGIAKTAAIANIGITTAKAAMNNYAWASSWGGPGAGAAAAGLAIAAGSIQAAKVAGVQLAEGGIVKSSVGGTQATIGEGGQDEAVIPLPDEGGLAGTTINISVGAMMGDSSEATEFAKMIDQELFELRKANESQAFDEALI